jgi:hypothetical protein
VNSCGFSRDYGGLMRVVRDEGVFDVEKVFFGVFGDFLKVFKKLYGFSA